jgi:hypothetical protein
MSPVAMIADADVFDKLRIESGELRVSFHGYCQRLHTLRSCDQTPIPIRLFLKTLPLLYLHLFIAI